MKSKRGKAQSFWEREYARPTHLAMSDTPSADLLEFMRWSDRQKDELDRVVDTPRVLDIGCGNGRNAVYMEEVSAATVWGFDISQEAIHQAQKKTNKANHFVVHDIHDFPYPYEDASVDVVLDMMSSHILGSAERAELRREINRILSPGGFLFYKTFLLEGDAHAKEMISKRPGEETNSYIHHRIGHTEYVLSLSQIIKEIESMSWKVHKISKSHRHMVKGSKGKRRTVSLYIQKPYDW